MFIKAINEEDLKNEEYLTAVMKDNFRTLMNDKIHPDKDNQIPNIIMSVALNRILVDLYPKFYFKSNQGEINRCFSKGEFYEMTLSRKDDASSLCLGRPYLKAGRNSITQVLKPKEADILLEDDPSYSRINYFTELLNGVLVDGAGTKSYDYYKSQYIYMAVLWFHKRGLDLEDSFIKPFDQYLDSMRGGMEELRTEVFLKNAENHYYNLNPYGELRPIREIDVLYDLINELNTHEFTEEMKEKAQGLIRSLYDFIRAVTQPDMPDKRRREILSDSDFANLSSFAESLEKERVDEDTMVKMRVFENLKVDLDHLNENVQKMRDRNYGR